MDTKSNNDLSTRRQKYTLSPHVHWRECEPKGQREVERKHAVRHKHRKDQGSYNRSIELPPGMVVIVYSAWSSRIATT